MDTVIVTLGVHGVSGAPVTRESEPARHSSYTLAAGHRIDRQLDVRPFFGRLREQSTEVRRILEGGSRGRRPTKVFKHNAAPGNSGLRNPWAIDVTIHCEMELQARCLLATSRMKVHMLTLINGY